ncbi:MAG: putative ABC transporter permease [Treponema sp.]|nr:putative ABC transporter permease [Treponema sp.]
MFDIRSLGPDRIIFAFFFFSFSGWVGECVMESIVRGRFVNKGFLKGPYVPVHGAGAFIVYASLFPLRPYPVLVFLAGAFLCTAVEYAAALILEKVFNVKCWDYETYPFTRWCHYKRRVALTTSLFFGFVTAALVYFYWDLCMYAAGLLGSRGVRITSAVFAAVFTADVFVTGGKYLRNKIAGICVKHGNDFS